MNHNNIRTDANAIPVEGDAGGSLFGPTFRCPDVWMTEDRLEARYSLEYGYAVRIVATITDTTDGATLVGAHATFDGEVTEDLGFRPTTHDDRRLDLLDAAGAVDGLFREFIAPQVLRAMVVAELQG